MQDCFIGLDVGTSATKAVLYDGDGRPCATATRSYRLQTPQPGFVELDPEQVWRAVVGTIRDVLVQADDPFVHALSVATQSGSLIPATAAGTPLHAMITWLDTRAQDVVLAWRAAGLEKMIWRTSGWHLSPGFPLPMIEWLRRHRPELFAATERYMGLNDFIIARLSGQFVTDMSSASEMLLVDLVQEGWSQTLCDLVHISPAVLPALRPSGTVVDTIRPDVARLTGLPLETPVVTGGHDQCCTALAMGITEPGQVMLAAGTAWVLTSVTTEPAVEDIPRQMDLSYHVVPARWTVSQLLGGYGAVLASWLAATWLPADSVEGSAGEELYEEMNCAVEAVPPGSRGLHFIAPGAGAQLTERLESGGLFGLRLDHTRADMARAVLEGVAYEVRWAFEALHDANMPVQTLWMAGGATRSRLWPSILADILGVPITLAETGNWPAQGAAMLAAAAVGARLARQQSEATARQEPCHGHAEAYRADFATYKGLVREYATLPTT